MVHISLVTDMNGLLKEGKVRVMEREIVQRGNKDGWVWKVNS